MAEEREITITLKAKNLTSDQFDAARAKLKELGIEADGMTNRGQRLGNAFKETGGIAGAFQSQLTRLAGAFALGAIIDRGVTAIASFASEALRSASNLVDLRNATGVSLEMLQRWTHVADQGGIQLENLTKSAFDLGVKLNSPSGSVRAAVEALGLSWSQLRALKPEDQLDTVLRASEKLGSEQERNAVLVELFGSKGALALGKIVNGYADTAAQAKVAGDAQVEALDRASDAWSKFKKDIGTGFAQAMGNIVLGFTEAGASVESLTEKERQQYNMLRRVGGEHLFLIEVAQKRAAAEKQAQEAVEGGASASAKAQRDYVSELANTRKELANMDAATRRQILAAQELGEKEDELTTRFNLSAGALKLLTEQNRSAEQASTKHADRLKAAHKVLEDFNREVDQQNAAILRGMATHADFTKAIERHTERVGEAIVKEALLRQEYVRTEAAQRVLFANLEQDATRAMESADLAQRILFANLETEAKRSTRNVGQAFSDAFGDVASILDQLPGKFFEVASAAARTGKAIADNLAEGDVFGAVVAGITGGITVIGKLFTDRHKEEVKKYNAEIKKVQESLLEQYGTMEDLEAAAQRVGLSFKENWGHQGKEGLEATNRLAKELEQRLKAVDAASSRAIGGLSAVVTGMTKPWTELGDRMKKALEDFDKADKALSEGLTGQGSIVELRNAFDKANDAQAAIWREIQAAAPGARQQLADLGAQAVATFGAAMVAGASYSQAIKQIGPSLATLGQSYKALGLDVEDVGLKHLILQSTIAEANPELIAATSGLGDSMQGLAQLGMLNVDTFGAMQRTGMAMYARLQGEVGALGGETRDALIPMQGYLQQAAIQAELLGIPLDANTQMLIDQSKELGIWKDRGKSAQDLLIEGMGALVKKVDELLTNLLGVSTAISGLPRRTDLEINVTENVTRNVNEIRTGGGEPEFTTGTHGLFPDFSDGTRVVLHHREAVTPYAERIPTAKKWLQEAGLGMAAAAPIVVAAPQVNIVNDFTGARQVTESEFKQVQARLYSGELQVPARAITQRGR